jgi:glyoxylase-like metal-dependent hydrolase (beta-lactamase superfamily II)
MLSVHFFELNPIQENTYIVYNEQGDCAIIDPGCYYEHERKLLKHFIEENTLTPRYLLNTHCHLDHVFGNTFVADTWQLPLYLHEGEIPVLNLAPKSGEMYGLPFENFKGDMKFLNENDVIHLGKEELKVLFTPGHSPASISFYSEKNGFVICGDVLFYGSIGRTDLPGGNFDVLQHSIKTKLYTLPENTKVYSGHGRSTTIEFEKKNNPFVRG